MTPRGYVCPDLACFRVLILRPLGMNAQDLLGGAMLPAEVASPRLATSWIALGCNVHIAQES